MQVYLISWNILIFNNVHNCSFWYQDFFFYFKRPKLIVVAHAFDITTWDIKVDSSLRIPVQSGLYSETYLNKTKQNSKDERSQDAWTVELITILPKRRKYILKYRNLLAWGVGTADFLVTFLFLWKGTMTKPTCRRRCLMGPYTFRGWVYDHYRKEEGSRCWGNS